MQFSGAPLRRLYAQAQTSVATILNSTGTWNSATAKLIPHIRIAITRVAPLIEAEYKTGTGSILAGILGGKLCGKFSGEVDVMPSGAAGTAPQCAPILANLFGAPGTVIASTSVTYNTLDHTSGNQVPPLTLALFNENGSGNTVQFGYGGVIQNWTVSIGGNGSVRITFDGLFFYVLESDFWASEDTTGKGGLTAFPTEPGSPALVGNIIPSYAGSVTFGGTSIPEFRSATIKGNTGRTLRMDGVGAYPDTAFSQGRRRISLTSLKFADSDGAGLATVKNAARSKTVLDVVIGQGNVAGYTLGHTIKAVQFGGEGQNYTENGESIDVDFPDAGAHASALANTNEYTLLLT